MGCAVVGWWMGCWLAVSIPHANPDKYTNGHADCADGDIDPHTNSDKHPITQSDMHTITHTYGRSQAHVHPYGG